MGRPKSLSKKNSTYLKYGFGGAAATAVLLWLFVFGGIQQIASLSGVTPATPTTPTTSFTFSIYDPLAGVELDGDDFDGLLYETNDLDDWLDFDLLKNYSTGVDVDEEDFEDMEKAILVLQLNGSVAHDDDLYGEEDEDDIGTRTYSSRWVIMNPTGANVINVYAAPSDAGVAILDAETIGSWNFTASNVTTCYDLLFVVASNASEPECAWVGMEDYSVEFNFVPNLLVEFNDSVSLADFSVSGTSKDRYNATALVFEFDIISSTPQTFLGRWSDQAVEDADLEILSITLLFGDLEV